MSQIFLQSASVILVMMFFAWLLSLWLRDASIIDPFWGLGFVLVAWAVYWLQSKASMSDLLLPILTTLWGVRLGGYLAWRNHGKPEDYRYQEMREKWGNKFPWVSLFTVFLLQGIIMWVVSLPIQLGIAGSEGNISILTLVGIAVWAIGLFFESVGDWQLARFKSNPGNRGVVLDTGLWRYTRHPNYFGDFLVWWGLYLTAFSLGAPWWTVVGPAMMSYFLMRVSGVTLLEKNLVITKPAYADYVSHTNAFFPGLPRS